MALQPLKAVCGKAQTPTKKARLRHPPLRTVADVSREMARLYWLARRGEVDIADASRLGNLLGNLGRLISNHAVDERLASLEELVIGSGAGAKVIEMEDDEMP